MQTRDLHELSSSQSNQPQPETPDMYLDTVEGNKKNTLAIAIQIQEKLIAIKVDSGAEVTAIMPCRILHGGP